MNESDGFKKYEIQCAELVMDGMYDEAVICGHKMLDIYEDEKRSGDLENIFSGRGHIILNIENFLLYLAYLKRLLEIYKTQNIIKKQVDVMCELGFAYSRGHVYHKAEHIFEAALNLAEKEYYYAGKADSINGLGNNQLHQENYEEALNFYKEAYTFSIEHKYDNGNRFAHNIGYSYKKLGNNEEAVKYLKMAQEWSFSVKNYQLCANNTNELGDAYRRIGEYEMAQYYLNKGLLLSKKIKNNHYISENFLFQTDLFAELGLYKDAFKAVKKHFEMAASINEMNYHIKNEWLKHQLEMKHKEDENQIVKLKNIELKTYSEQLNLLNKELKNALFETKKMQRALIQSEKEAAFNRMLVVIAHAMNTPIGNIIMGVSNLQELLVNIEGDLDGNSLKKKDLEKYLEISRMSYEMIRGNSDKMSHFIDKLKKDSITIEEMGSESDIDRIIENCIEDYKDEIKAISCELVLKIEPEIRPVKGAKIYRQVFDQLFDNTFRHAFKDQEHCQISIKVSYLREMLIIIFCDNGIGIDGTLIHSIFDPFYTSNIGTAVDMGLGLYITHKIITEIFSGTIECDSSLGSGTTFIISIPVFE